MSNKKILIMPPRYSSLGKYTLMQKSLWLNRIFFVLSLIIFTYSSAAQSQKKTDGIKFAGCLNHKDLPKDFFKGKFLVLDFWATWCGPCIGSFPKLNALQQKYKNDSRLVFAAMSAERAGHLDTFFKKKENILPGVLHLADQDGATWEYLQINLIPRIFVFNPSGKIVFDGHVEELSKDLDKLLSGADMTHEDVVVTKEDKWETYKRSASFMAITGPVDSTISSGGYSHFSNDKSDVSIELRNQPLLEIISQVGNLSSVSVRCNDASKCQQRIMLCYKQVKNEFPEFNNGIFGYQYQNHILDVLRREYAFECKWVTEKVSAYKLVVADAEKLRAAETISQEGSFGSNSGNGRYTLTNQRLAAIGDLAENAFETAFVTDSSAAGYDLELDLSSLAAFEKSLSIYGLAINKLEGHEMRKLELVF